MPEHNGALSALWTDESREPTMKVLTALMIVTLLSLADGATGQERPKVTSISHIAVYTTDPAKAQRFMSMIWAR